MKALLTVAVIGLSLVTAGALAKDKDKDKGKSLPPGLEKKLDNGGDLPPGLYKKVGHGGGLPPGWYKRYHHGDILDRDIYRHGRVIKRRDRNGIIAIEIDDRLIHLVHDTREILSIVTRHR